MSVKKSRYGVDVIQTLVGDMSCLRCLVLHAVLWWSSRDLGGLQAPSFTAIKENGLHSGRV